MSVCCNFIYKQRFTDAETALMAVESGMTVYVPGNASSVKITWDALLERLKVLTNVKVVRMLSDTDALTADLYADHAREIAPFIGAPMRKPIADGKASFLPIFLKDVPWLLGKNGPLRPDVAIIHVAPPDENGYCNLGVCTGLDHAPAHSARIVIAEVNENMPQVRGEDAKIRLADIDYLVTSPPRNLVEVPMGEPDEISNRIGRHIAEIIPDGATLQLGIGAIPNAVLSLLGTHKDLGIHSEMVSDGIVDLVNAGVINGRRSKLAPGKMSLGFVIGTSKIYSFMNKNDFAEFHRQEFINNPNVIGLYDHMISINSALMVDLTGQVCASSLMPDRPFISGFGGQVDFVRGARTSCGGRSIIALASSTKGKSKIVPTLPEGSTVTTTSGDVQCIATEHGIVNLAGKTVDERAKLLISIADPIFREKLAREAWDVWKVNV